MLHWQKWINLRGMLRQNRGSWTSMWQRMEQILRLWPRSFKSWLRNWRRKRTRVLWIGLMLIWRGVRCTKTIRIYIIRQYFLCKNFKVSWQSGSTTISKLELLLSNLILIWLRKQTKLNILIWGIGWTRR